VFVPYWTRKCRQGRFHSRLFFATPLPEVVATAAIELCPFFSFSPRVLSMRETFPLAAVLTGDSFLDEDPCSTLAFFLGDFGSSAAPTNRSCFFGVLNTRGPTSPSSPPGEGDRPRVVLRKDRRVGVVGNNNLGGRAKSGEKSGCSGGSLLWSEGL